MTCTPAPACVTMRKEATALWPGRSQASDGICASPKHTATNPTSDHELGNAVDLTHDPAHGVDCHALADQVKNDPRVKYVIWNRRISNPTIQGGAWRAYSGSNPHTKHMHVSILASARGDTSPWFDQGDDDLTPTESEWLGTVHHHLADGSAFRKKIDDIHEWLNKLDKGVEYYAIEPVGPAASAAHRNSKRIAEHLGVTAE